MDNYWSSSQAPGRNLDNTQSNFAAASLEDGRIARSVTPYGSQLTSTQSYQPEPYIGPLNRSSAPLSSSSLYSSQNEPRPRPRPRPRPIPHQTHPESQLDLFNRKSDQQYLPAVEPLITANPISTQHFAPPVQAKPAAAAAPFLPPARPVIARPEPVLPAPALAVALAPAPALALAPAPAPTHAAPALAPAPVPHAPPVSAPQNASYAPAPDPPQDVDVRASNNADSDSDGIVDADELFEARAAAKNVSKKVQKSGKATISTRASKSKNVKVNKDSSSTSESTKWTADDSTVLYEHILNPDEDNFELAEAKGSNDQFWNKVAKTVFPNQFTGPQLRHHWNEAKNIFKVIDSFQNFTGGGGDGDESDLQVDSDDDEESALAKLNRRIETIHKRKPNLDPSRKIKSAEIYHTWIRGGEDSWYMKMKQRFQDRKNLTREVKRGTGRRTEISDSDDDVPSSKTDQKSKPSRSAAAMEGMATVVKDLRDDRKAANQAKDSVAMERLKFEKERAAASDSVEQKKLDLEETLLKFRIEMTQRKWEEEKSAKEKEDRESKRRKTDEDVKLKQELLADEIKLFQNMVKEAGDDVDIRNIALKQLKQATENLRKFIESTVQKVAQ
ncbi:hypothetical protein RSOLAG22IIIB_12963 [Rhizoctonia solani]|uniref:Myb-like domain-containing protein n=1 Tax=Rhizoctonia solani TaxID=456999 RepID=A0A0K6GHC2_9AGAM|nr:hypothetical protein RSOLAG22IIIB_12963 [Rhizoctonia solani]